jgi:hypothetical protein
LLKRARIRALERDTSVNALVRGYLERLAGKGEAAEAVAAVLALAEHGDAGSGSAGRTWTRAELYER